jgi:excisionase family DNA binding protein
MLPDKPSFTVSEAIRYLGIGRATVYRWMMSGELEVLGFRYHYRISRSSLEKKLSQLSQHS